MVPKEQNQEHIVEEFIDVNNVLRERVSEHILEQNCRKPWTKL